MIRLSACMMARNEEDLLPRALESIRGLVDEIVLVDTGSVDRTVEIAESFRARVFHHPWEDDFSLHRNQSLSYATGDWLLVIDADERLAPAPGYDREKLLACLAALGPEHNAAAVNLVDIQQGRPVMRTFSVRLFRNGRVRYRNRVHNAPVYDGPVASIPELTLEHRGYDLSPERMEAKFRRTRDLLFRQREEEPENTRVLFYLSQLYGMREEHEQCLAWGRGYLDQTRRRGEAVDPTALYTLARTCQKIGRHEEALAYAREGLERTPEDPDLCLVLADAGALTGNPRLMAEGCRHYLDGLRRLEANPTAFGGRFLFSLREDILAVQLYRLMSVSLQEGLSAWDCLRPRLGKAPAGLRTSAQELIESLDLTRLLAEAPAGAE